MSDESSESFSDDSSYESESESGSEDVGTSFPGSSTSVLSGGLGVLGAPIRPLDTVDEIASSESEGEDEGTAGSYKIKKSNLTNLFNTPIIMPDFSGGITQINPTPKITQTAPSFQPMGQPVFQPMGQPVLQPMGQPVFQPMGQQVTQPVFQPMGQQVTQPVFQ